MGTRGPWDIVLGHSLVYVRFGGGGGKEVDSFAPGTHGISIPVLLQMMVVRCYFET